MRSFPVRTATLLAIALLFAALYLLSEKSGAPDDAPPPIPQGRPEDPRRAADRRKAGLVPAVSPKTLLSPPRATSSPPSPEDATIASLRARIADVDRETSGFFLEELDRVLSDPGLSVEADDFRLPAGNGNTAMLATFPDETTDSAEEHRRLVLIIVASAFRGCASSADFRHRLDELTVRYPWLVAFVSQQ